MTHRARLLASAFTFALAAAAQDAANYNVTGMVVDSLSQKPLANARVLLAPTTMRVQRLEQVTKQDGRFSFALSQAGKYSLQISKPGYPLQSYRQASFSGISSAIVVRDDQDTRHIVFLASRGGAISGQIKDEDSEPVDNALVTVFQSLIVGGERKIVPRGQARANAAGEFRLAGLRRGSYYVCAMGRPWFADSLIRIQDTAKNPQFSPDPSFRGTAFVTTFYPRAPAIEEASLIRLDAGGEAQASITLPLTKAVTVKGAIASSGEMSAGRAVLLKKVYDQYVSFLDDVVPKEGTFQFKNVPAGAYQIMATSDSSSGASSWNVGQEVTVGTSDMEVTLRPGPMSALSGHVLFEGGEGPASGVNIFVILRNDKGNLARIQMDSEGNFSLARLLPGHYDVSAGSPDYVASYFTGPSGERLPLALEVASGETIRRDLMLTKAVSVIEGTVEHASTPQVGAFVLLLPKNPEQRWAYRMDQTDSDGSYRLASIPAGDYFLISLSDGTDVLYRDAKVAAILVKVGKPVHIEPGDHLDLKLDLVTTSTLHLPSL